MAFLFLINTYIAWNYLFQINMKSKLSRDKLASLTQAYHQTYGSHGAVAGNYSDAVMSSLVSAASSVICTKCLF